MKLNENGKLTKYLSDIHVVHSFAVPSYQSEPQSTYFLSILWIEVWYGWILIIIWETNIFHFTTMIANCGPLYCYFSKLISSLVSSCKALKSNMCTNQKLVLWSNAIILREQGKREIRISMWEKTKQIYLTAELGEKYSS